MPRHKSERVEVVDENASLSSPEGRQRPCRGRLVGGPRRRKKPGLEAPMKRLREGLKFLKKKQHGPNYPDMPRPELAGHAAQEGCWLNGVRLGPELGGRPS